MSLVLDASILVELLTGSSVGERALPHVRGSAGDLHVPHLADIEVASVARGLARAGALTEARGMAMLTDLREFPARRWEAGLLLERIWQLRPAITAYDATYIALTEALGGTLVTADTKLAHGADGVARCEIVLVAVASGPAA